MPIITVIAVPMIIIIISEILACVTTVIHPVGAFSLPGFVAVGASILAVSRAFSSLGRSVVLVLTAGVLPGARSFLPRTRSFLPRTRIFLPSARISLTGSLALAGVSSSIGLSFFHTAAETTLVGTPGGCAPAWGRCSSLGGAGSRAGTAGAVTALDGGGTAAGAAAAGAATTGAATTGAAATAAPPLRFGKVHHHERGHNRYDHSKEQRTATQHESENDIFHGVSPFLLRTSACTASSGKSARNCASSMDGSSCQSDRRVTCCGAPSTCL